MRPSYTGYRAAFDAVMLRTSMARGRISGAANRGWSDDETHQALAQKVRNMPTGTPHAFLS